MHAPLFFDFFPLREPTNGKSKLSPTNYSFLSRFSPLELKVLTGQNSKVAVGNRQSLRRLDSCHRHNMAAADVSSEDVFTLDSVRESLARQEDTIIFCLIERARFPANAPIYNETLNLIPGFSGSFVEFVVRETEAVQAKAGRYENPEENPFFPDSLPPSLAPFHKYTKFLHPAGASININKNISDMYITQLLPLFVIPGDDGDYAVTAASDLDCLQALSRRIHYGKFVAEVKFRDAPQDYKPAIRSMDRDGLMKLLTAKSVEDTVKQRVEKKAMVFGQEVSVEVNNTNGEYKVDPLVVGQLYEEWVVPLTKLVQVEYLLRRLD